MEQRWAAFFDYITLDWDREPDKFTVDGFSSAYLPDFKLKNVVAGGSSPDLYAEVRPADNVNAKAMALSDKAPVLFLTGEPVDNVPMVLRFGGVERTVRINGDGQVVLHEENARPIQPETDSRVMRAVLRAMALDFEALQAETLSTAIGVDRDQLGLLSRDALLLLHIINTSPAQPSPNEQVQSQAEDAGLSREAATRAIAELKGAGLVSDKERRRQTFDRTFRYW